VQPKKGDGCGEASTVKKGKGRAKERPHCRTEKNAAEAHLWTGGEVGR